MFQCAKRSKKSNDNALLATSMHQFNTSIALQYNFNNIQNYTGTTLITVPHLFISVYFNYCITLTTTAVLITKKRTCRSISRAFRKAPDLHTTVRQRWKEEVEALTDSGILNKHFIRPYNADCRPGSPQGSDGLPPRFHPSFNTAISAHVNLQHGRSLLQRQTGLFVIPGGSFSVQPRLANRGEGCRGAKKL